MVLTDAGGTILAANPAYCALHRFSASDLIGSSLALIVPEAERTFAISQYRAVVRATLAGASLEAAEPRPAVAQWRDGSDRVVESRIDLLIQDDHRAAMLSTVRVITRQSAASTAAMAQGALLPSDLPELTPSAADEVIAAIHD